LRHDEAWNELIERTNNADLGENSVNERPLMMAMMLPVTGSYIGFVLEQRKVLVY